ncbi:chaperone protein dnaJ A6, chloroplastic-like isoform X1 [Iris pallida]|uniref:Chaperone protein dnaJ A6, chloroplastic-like isoform X1 n=1 Tax=Iris pallida TaxID=29817 RepID=A0AAX6EFW8_IRIPA|nr:chaperone protein dnaJ A6, chloroplastic-like isoform X1 [Iris pallida]
MQFFHHSPPSRVLRGCQRRRLQEAGGEEGPQRCREVGPPLQGGGARPDVLLRRAPRPPRLCRSPLPLCARLPLPAPPPCRACRRRARPRRHRCARRSAGGAGGRVGDRRGGAVRGFRRARRDPGDRLIDGKHNIRIIDGSKLVWLMYCGYAILQLSRIHGKVSGRY